MIGGATCRKSGADCAAQNVRFWPKADITARLIHVRFWG
jgi:hypothetical protein